MGGDVIFIRIVCSKDPNDIVGPEGYGSNKMVSKFNPQPYMIRFENDPDFATAPAQVVKIIHPLDKNVNPLSFRLGDFGFGKFNFQVPTNKTYYTTRLDVMADLGVVVDVMAGIDVTKREAFWIFESKDPQTGLPPADASLGFLLVNNDTGVGEGYVRYTVRLAESTVTGDTIHAHASIVFDVNAALETPTIFNTVDAAPPVSKVKNLPASTLNTTIKLSWSGKDDTKGSGKRDYTVFVSENNGVFTSYQSGLTDSTTTFTGNPESTYRFFTLATDNVGIQEEMKNVGEATVTLGVAPAIEAPTDLIATATSHQQINLTWIDNAANETEILVERSGTAEGPYTVVATLPANTTAYSNIGLTPKTTYFYRVKARNATDQSDYSNEASATTKDDVTGLPEEQRSLVVKVYPNPAQKKFVLEYTSAQRTAQTQVVMYTETGMIVKKWDLKGKGGTFKQTIAIPELAAGVYILQLIDADQSYYKRIVKE
jgi:hypothetical protein